MTATRRPFTLIVCAGCAAAGELTSAAVLEALRPSVRRCPHGMLVVAECPLSQWLCRSRHEEPGALVMLQPCFGDRTPAGPAAWLGPVATADDAMLLARWIEAGRWDVAALPVRLRSRLSDPAGVAAAN